MPSPPLDPARIAAIVADAKVLGNKAAAEKHGVSTKTVERYKKRAQADRTVSEAVAEKVEKVHASWLEHAKSVRGRILDKIDKLVSEADKTMVREVVGALKIVDDSIRADKVVGRFTGELDDDGGRVGAGAQVAAAGGAAAEGVRDGTGSGGNGVH